MSAQYYCRAIKAIILPAHALLPSILQNIGGNFKHEIIEKYLPPYNKYIVIHNKPFIIYMNMSIYYRFDQEIHPPFQPLEQYTVQYVNIMAS